MEMSRGPPRRVARRLHQQILFTALRTVPGTQSGRHVHSRKHPAGWQQRAWRGKQKPATGGRPLWREGKAPESCPPLSLPAVSLIRPWRETLLTEQPDLGFPPGSQNSPPRTNPPPTSTHRGPALSLQAHLRLPSSWKASRIPPVEVSSCKNPLDLLVSLPPFCSGLRPPVRELPALPHRGLLGSGEAPLMKGSTKGFSICETNEASISKFTATA